MSIEIQGIPFLANLILLDSKDLDVILGMNFLTLHQVVLDCARRTVTLHNGPDRPVIFYAHPTLSCQQVLHQIRLNWA